MSRLHILDGLHEGTVVDIPTGLLEIGAGPDQNLILLDEGVPDCALSLFSDEEGRIKLCRFDVAAQLFNAHGRAVDTVLPMVLNEPFLSEEQGQKTSDGSTRIEPSLVDDPVERVWYVSVAGVRLQIVCRLFTDTAGSAPADVAEQGIGDSDLQETFSGSGVAALRMRLAQYTRLMRMRFLSIGRGKRYAIATGCGLLLIGIFYQVVSSNLSEIPSENSIAAPSRFDSLRLSYQLTLGHVPPSLPKAELFAEPIGTVEQGIEGPSQASGHDATDQSSLKLSTDLTLGITLRDGDLTAQQVQTFFQDRTPQHPWISRLVFNMRGSRVVIRGVLSEAERLEFERLLTVVAREYGQQVSFRIVIDPFEVPVQLQVKQVLGGANPVAILEDGSRLTPGSFYEGRLVESITVERIVLRGKDRIEIPI